MGIVFQSQRQLNWGRKDTSQIPENLPGAFDGAYAAAQAEGFINDGTVFHHLDSPGGTQLCYSNYQMPNLRL